MKEIIINDNEAGQRFDKYLKKYMKEAPGSFLYKMLRKKNIVLNGKKASGNEKIEAGDSVKLFLSDETIEKFKGQQEICPGHEKIKEQLDIIYEDDNVLFINKPAGMLSQKAEKTDVSVVEHLIAYMRSGGKITDEELKTFKPSVCNRLDRNTSGIIVAGKSLKGLQVMGEIFKDRTLKKYYLCFVKGKITKKTYIKGYLKKNEKNNQAVVYKENMPGSVLIETEYEPVAYGSDMTLLMVHLITGRTHQIRAHLSSQGHPVLGDYKYGDSRWNSIYKERYGITHQMLHAYRLEMPELKGAVSNISNETFYAPVSSGFWNVIKETAWEHGTQEALEVLH